MHHSARRSRSTNPITRKGSIVQPETETVEREDPFQSHIVAPKDSQRQRVGKSKERVTIDHHRSNALPSLVNSPFRAQGAPPTNWKQPIPQQSQSSHFYGSVEPFQKIKASQARQQKRATLENQSLLTKEVQKVRQQIGLAHIDEPEIYLGNLLYKMDDKHKYRALHFLNSNWARNHSSLHFQWRSVGQSTDEPGDKLKLKVLCIRLMQLLGPTFAQLDQIESALYALLRLVGPESSQKEVGSRLVLEDIIDLVLLDYEVLQLQDRDSSPIRQLRMHHKFAKVPPSETAVANRQCKHCSDVELSQGLSEQPQAIVSVEGQEQKVEPLVVYLDSRIVLSNNKQQLESHRTGQVRADLIRPRLGLSQSRNTKVSNAPTFGLTKEPGALLVEAKADFKGGDRVKLDVSPEEKSRNAATRAAGLADLEQGLKRVKDPSQQKAIITQYMENLLSQQRLQVQSEAIRTLNSAQNEESLLREPFFGTQTSLMSQFGRMRRPHLPYRHLQSSLSGFQYGISKNNTKGSNHPRQKVPYHLKGKLPSTLQAKSVVKLNQTLHSQLQDQSQLEGNYSHLEIAHDGNGNTPARRGRALQSPFGVVRERRQKQLGECHDDEIGFEYQKKQAQPGGALTAKAQIKKELKNLASQEPQAIRVQESDHLYRHGRKGEMMLLEESQKMIDDGDGSNVDQNEMSQSNSYLGLRNIQARSKEAKVGRRSLEVEDQDEYHRSEFADFVARRQSREKEEPVLIGDQTQQKRSLAVSKRVSGLSSNTLRGALKNGKVLQDQDAHLQASAHRNSRPTYDASGAEVSQFRFDPNNRSYSVIGQNLFDPSNNNSVRDDNPLGHSRKHYVLGSSPGPINIFMTGPKQEDNIFNISAVTRKHSQGEDPPLRGPVPQARPSYFSRPLTKRKTDIKLAGALNQHHRHASSIDLANEQVAVQRVSQSDAKSDVMIQKAMNLHGRFVSGQKVGAAQNQASPQPKSSALMVLQTSDAGSLKGGTGLPQSLERTREEADHLGGWRKQPSGLDIVDKIGHEQGEEEEPLCFICGLEFEDHALDHNIDLLFYTDLLQDCFANNLPGLSVADEVAAPAFLSSHAHSVSQSMVAAQPANEEPPNSFSQLKLTLLKQQRRGAEEQLNSPTQSPRFLPDQQDRAYNDNFFDDSHIALRKSSDQQQKSKPRGVGPVVAKKNTSLIRPSKSTLFKMGNQEHQSSKLPTSEKISSLDQHLVNMIQGSRVGIKNESSAEARQSRAVSPSRLSRQQMAGALLGSGARPSRDKSHPVFTSFGVNPFASGNALASTAALVEQKPDNTSPAATTQLGVNERGTEIVKEDQGLKPDSNPSSFKNSSKPLTIDNQKVQKHYKSSQAFAYEMANPMVSSQALLGAEKGGGRDIFKSISLRSVGQYVDKIFLTGSKQQSVSQAAQLKHLQQAFSRDELIAFETTKDKICAICANQITQEDCHACESKVCNDCLGRMGQKCPFCQVESSRKDKTQAQAQAQAQAKLYCLNCGASKQREPSDRERWKCSNCMQERCALCLLEAHEGSSCGANAEKLYTRLKKPFASVTLDPQITVQMCVQCSGLLHRAPKCDHYFCEDCKVVFCMYCRQPHTADHMNPFSQHPCCLFKIGKNKGQSSLNRQESPSCGKGGSLRCKLLGVFASWLLLAPLSLLIFVPFLTYRKTVNDKRQKSPILLQKNYRRQSSCSTLGQWTYFALLTLMSPILALAAWLYGLGLITVQMCCTCSRRASQKAVAGQEGGLLGSISRRATQTSRKSEKVHTETSLLPLRQRDC